MLFLLYIIIRDSPMLHKDQQASSMEAEDNSRHINLSPNDDYNIFKLPKADFRGFTQWGRTLSTSNNLNASSILKIYNTMLLYSLIFLVKLKKKNSSFKSSNFKQRPRQRMPVFSDIIGGLCLQMIEQCSFVISKRHKISCKPILLKDN